MSITVIAVALIALGAGLIVGYWQGWSKGFHAGKGDETPQRSSTTHRLVRLLQRALVYVVDVDHQLASDMRTAIALEGITHATP